MWKVKNKIIQESEIVILQKLREQLNELGISRFHAIKPTSDNIMVSCPSHKEGQEKKPSCGISTIEREGTPAGTVHCFSCGYVSTLPEMISFVFGYDDGGVFGTKWLMENFISTAISNREDLEVPHVNRNIKLLDTFVSEEELAKYEFIHNYVYRRGINDDMINLYQIGYDRDTRCITFPVKNRSGKTHYICRRSVESKYFNYPQGVEKHLYGVYELPKGLSEVVITESCFNAITSTQYGRPAIALLGRSLTDLQFRELCTLGVRTIVLAMDGDVYGRTATRIIAKQLKSKFIIKYLVVPPGKDINDLTKKQFIDLEEFFI